MKTIRVIYRFITWALCLCLMSDYSTAQDTLRFRDKTTIAGKITSFEHKKGLIRFEHNHQISILSMSALEAYFYHGNWVDIDSKPDSYLPIPDLGYFHRKTSFEQGNWSISTNLVSPFRGHKNRVNFGHGFQSGMMVGLEPEYQRGHWALKLPININPSPVKFKYTGFSPYYDGLLDYKTYERDVHDYQAPTYFEKPNRARYYWQPYPHVPTSIFEAGIYPKYYFGINRKRSFYASAGLSMGRGDHLAVDYYHTFKFNSAAWGILFDPILWQLTDTRYVLHRNPFNYFRQELLLGLDFNFAKHFALNFESGFSSKMPYKGEKPDRVFAREQGGEYELAYTRKYDNRYKGKWSFIPIGKAHLVYRF